MEIMILLEGSRIELKDNKVKSDLEFQNSDFRGASLEQ